MLGMQNIPERVTFELLIGLLIQIPPWFQTVCCAHPSVWVRSAVSWFTCSLRLICPCCQRVSGSGLHHPPPHPPTSLHVCVYERVRIIAHQLSSLMGLISINITVERTFALQQPAVLTNPSSWQWVPGGLHNCLTGFFSFFRVAERQKPRALFELLWCCVVKLQEYMRERDERFPWRVKSEQRKSCRREN